MPTRRAVLLASAGVTGATLTAAVGWRLGPGLVTGAEPWIPDDPEGVVRVDRVRSAAMGGDVDLFTAVPHGFGDGHGLPVVVVLHGASASARDLRTFGLGRFVTAAVRAGTPPFVLAGTDDGPAGWVPDGSGPDPQAMVLDELPAWLAQRGFDANRRVLWGWSRGGYGVLRLAEVAPDWPGAAALFSPAVVEGDLVFDDLDVLAPLPLGVWCGTDDPFVDAVQELVDALPVAPEVATFADGAHTRVFWNEHTLDAFGWLASRL